MYLLTSRNFADVEPKYALHEDADFFLSLFFTFSHGLSLSFRKCRGYAEVNGRGESNPSAFNFFFYAVSSKTIELFPPDSDMKIETTNNMHRKKLG